MNTNHSSPPLAIEKILQNKSIKPLAIWFTGLSGSGKTTLGQIIEKRLRDSGALVKLLDGDILRNGLNNNLGFSLSDRHENIRRAAEVSRLFVQSGFFTINCFITPTHELQQMVKEIIGSENLMSVYLDTPVEVCEERDVKGLYRKARLGVIPEFTGISSPFEPPIQPSLVIATHCMTIDEAVEQIITAIIKTSVG